MDSFRLILEIPGECRQDAIAFIRWMDSIERMLSSARVAVTFFAPDGEEKIRFAARVLSAGIGEIPGEDLAPEA